MPNRSNYIHWVEDLLSFEMIPKKSSAECNVRGFDIGTGANCIYPLLGASLLGWSFVGSGTIFVVLYFLSQFVSGLFSYSLTIFAYKHTKIMYSDTV